VDGSGFIFANDAAQVLARQLTTLPPGSPASALLAVAPAPVTALGSDSSPEEPAFPKGVSTAGIRDAALSQWRPSDAYRSIGFADRLASSQSVSQPEDQSAKVTDDVFRALFD
jgi:hypothetical protein